MNCTNCGAPMVLVRQQEYFVCQYCGSFYFPAPAQDGIRVLGTELQTTLCPVCRTPLAAALIDRWPGLHCHTCRGVWIGQEHFRTIIEYRRAHAVGPPDPPRPLHRADLRRKLHCPRCGRTMHTHPYYGPGNFVIDSCPHCQSVWLDHGELNTATRAPGRDRGRRRTASA